MRLLWLCCFVCVLQGCCLGLDLDSFGLDDALEYHYKFEGRVAVDLGGIGSKPNARDGDQMAGAAISGKLMVQKTGNSSIGFKLSELKVGDHLGRVECNGAAPLPVHYRPMPQPMAAQLSKPFFFQIDPDPFDSVSKRRLEVPKDDLLWMVNLRKSLLNNLQDYMVIFFSKLHQNKNLDLYLRQKSSIKFSPIMEHVVEDTLFGLCGVWYTIESATEASLDHVRNSPLSHDMQLPRFQGRKLANGRRIFPFASESLMRVTRVIDHARCLQQPRLIRSTVANFSDFARPSPAHHLQRHSTYTYYVRGNPFNIYRLEHVRVEGFLSYNPFGFNSERLQTVTNQTMVLEFVAEKQHDLLPDDAVQVLNSLKQSVESPYSRPSSDALDWIVYNMSNSDPDSPEPVYWEKVLLGRPVTSEVHQKYKDDLRELLRRSLLSLQSDTLMPWGGSAESLGGSSVGQAAAQLHSAARLAAALPTSALQELWDDIPEAHRETFLKVLSSSGSGPAAGLVLHLITPQGPDSPLPVPTRKHPSLLLAMAANTPDPSLAAPLVQYLQAMSLREEPVVGPIVYVSGATILRRMCSDSSAVPSPLYGSHQCPVQYVIQNFAHYLHEMIQASDGDRWWERATFLQAYVTLGLDIDLLLLEDLGRNDRNLIVRTTAVYALSPRYLNSAFKHKAMQIAFSNIVDPTLDRELRQSSLVVLLSWSPDQEYWNQLALYTWSNHSTPIARFLYSSMLAVADNPAIDPLQSACASSALQLARALETPLRSSVDLAWLSSDVQSEMELRGRHAWFRFPPASHSSQVYHALHATAGKLDFNIFELAVGFNHYPGVMSPVESSHRQDSASHTPQMKLLFKLLSMEVYLPIDFSEFGIGSYSTCPLCELLWYSLGPCGSGSGEEILLFGELAAMETFIPNEMGLPILAELMNPTVLYSNTTVSGTSCREPLTGQFNLVTDTKLVSKTTSVLRVLVPWLNSSLAVGVDTEKTLSLPLKVIGKFEKIYRTKQERKTNPSQRHTGGAVNSDSYNSQFTGRKLRQGPAGIPVSPGTKIALTMALQITRNDLVPVAVTQAVPFSCIKPLRPGNDPAALERLLVLRNSNSEPVEQTINLGHKITGIDASLRYEGDQPSPYSLSSLIDHIRTPAKFVSLFGARSGKYECSMLSLVPSTSRNDATVITVFLDTNAVDRSSVPAGDAFCRSKERGVAECSPITTVGVEATFPSGQVLAGNLTHHLLPQEDPHYASSAASLSLFSSLYHGGNQLVQLVGSTTRPVDLSLPQLADWLHVGRSLNASFELNVWAGASSSSVSRVLKLKAEAGVTPERCRLLEEKVKTACSADLMEPALSLDGLAVYDALNVTTEHQNGGYPGLAVPWRALQDYLFASLYPSVLPVYGECGCSSAKDATMIANRSLLTNDWSASCPSCCRPWIAADLKLPRCFDTYILALAKFTNFSSDPSNDYHVPETVRVVADGSLYPVVDTWNTPQPVDSSLSFDYSNYGASPHASSNGVYYDDIAHRVDNSDVYNNYDYNSDDSSSFLDAEQGACWTSNDKLRTADGLHLTKIPSSCYQLAVAHCYFEPQWYVFTHVDVNAGADARSPFFRYLDADFDVDVYLGFNTLIINGKRQGPVVDRITITHPVTQQEIGWCSASTAEGRTSCTVTGVVHMEAKRQSGSVKLLGSDRVCGMCGDNNGAMHDDNVGAHLCRYRDLSLMAASWTVRNSSLPSHALSSSNPNQEKTSDNLDQVSNIFDGCCTHDPELLDAIRRVEEIENSPECDHSDEDIDSFIRVFKDLPAQAGNSKQEDTVPDQPAPEPIEVSHQPAAGPDEVGGLHLMSSNRVNDVSEPECMFSAYRIITEPGNEFPVLLSLEPTHFCRKEYNCYPVMPEKTLVRLYGWRWQEAPTAVLIGISQGYLLELPEDLTADHSELRIIKHPSSCEVH